MKAQKFDTLVTLDFETYYSQQYSLRKMTTEEYIRHPDFYAQMCGIKINSEPTFVVPSGDLKHAFAQFNWRKTAALAHHAHFDGLILSHHYGVQPKHWFDTLSMARAIHGTQVGGSLAKLAAHYNVGAKGKELANAMGIRDLPPALYESMAGYCANDVELTFALFILMRNKIPKMESEVINLVVKMFTRPTLRLDGKELKTYIEEEQKRKATLITDLQAVLGADSEDDVKDMLMSNQKFAAILEAYGVEPPMKVSPATQKPTLALAKTDKGMTDLLEHENETVRDLAAARLGTKSTINETRAIRMMDMGSRGPACVYLNFSGAEQTHRLSGGDKMNWQNFPQAKKARLRHAIQSPRGTKLVAVDSSNIELRVNHVLAGQHSTVGLLRAGEDLYCDFASQRYKRVITKADTQERQYGKVCLGADTQVLTPRGWVPIVSVLVTDMVWDGVEWVTHAGLQYQGYKWTMRSYGVTATPAHEILTGHGWQAWSAVCTGAHLFRSALSSANLPSSAGAAGSTPTEYLAGSTLGAGVHAATNLSSSGTTLRSGAPLGATHAQNAKHKKHGIVSTTLRSLAQAIVNGCSTGCHPPSAAVTTPPTKRTNITARAVSQCMNRGAPIAQSFSATLSRWTAGITRNWNSTASMSTAGTPPAICGSVRDGQTSATSAGSQTSNSGCGNSNQKTHVYDLLNAGPRQRFTILTDAGPIIVHNCHLALGYGMGDAKFATTARLWGLKIDDGEALQTVRLYRSLYAALPRWWYAWQEIIPTLASGRTAGMHEIGIRVGGGMIQMDGFLPLRYPDLRQGADGEWTIQSRNGRTKVYGAKLVENITQWVARNIVMEQTVTIAKRFPVVMSVHDEVVYLCRDGEEDEALAFGVEVMSRSPDWFPQIPLGAEGHAATSYGDCK